MWIKCLPGIHRSDCFGLSSVSVIHTRKHMTGFDLEENISVQHQKNQKTNSCSIQYDWDTDKMRTVPVLCSWLLYAYAAMVWRELLMFLVYYNRRVSIKTPVQRKTSSWEQVVKSRLKCLVGALGKSSRAGGLFWPGAGSPELPSCATSHTARAREQHGHCSWGAGSVVQPRCIRLNLCSRRICLCVMSPGCLKWISSIM